MSAGSKVLDKLENNHNYLPSWKELCSLMRHLGYEQRKCKGGGSGFKFIHKQKKRIYMCHKPHPQNEICRGARAALMKHLDEHGELNKE